MQLALSVPPSRAAQRTSPSAMSPALLPAARAAATRHATPRERAADPSASWSRTPQTPSDARTRKVWLSSRRSVVTSAASLMPPPRHSLPPRARATATCAMRPPQVRRHPQVGVGPQLRYPLWELQLPGSSGRGWDHHLPLAGWRVDGDAHLPAAPAAHAPARRVDSLHLFPPSSSRDLAEISTSPAESTFCASAGSDAAWSRVAKATNVDGSPSPPASSPPSPPPSPRAQSTVRQSPQLTTYRDAHSTRPALVHQDTSISRPKASLAEPVLPHQRHARARTVLLAALAVALRHRPPRCRKRRRLACTKVPGKFRHGKATTARGDGSPARIASRTAAGRALAACSDALGPRWPSKQAASTYVDAPPSPPIGRGVRCVRLQACSLDEAVRSRTCAVSGVRWPVRLECGSSAA